MAVPARWGACVGLAETEFRQWAQCVLALCWEGNGIWDDSGAQSAPWTRHHTTRAGGQSRPRHSSPCIRVLCQPAPMGRPQLQPAPCCRAGLLPREGSLPVPLGSHAEHHPWEPPGAPPTPSRPRSAWCSSRSRSRSSRCWDAARQELIPLILLLGYSTAGADPAHPTVGMLHSRSRSRSPPCRVAAPSPWSCRTSR